MFKGHLYKNRGPMAISSNFTSKTWMLCYAIAKKKHELASSDCCLLNYGSEFGGVRGYCFNFVPLEQHYLRECLLFIWKSRRKWELEFVSQRGWKLSLKIVHGKLKLTQKGVIASNIQEVHCLIMGDLYEQGREIALFLPSDPKAAIPNSTFTWGPQPYKGLIYLSDWNSGIWAVKLGDLQE